MGETPGPAHASGRDVIVVVRVVPRASRSSVEGAIDGALRVRIAAPPVEGEANAELVRLLAKVFDLPRRSVSIDGGEHSRSKRVRLVGADLSAVVAAIDRLDAPTARRSAARRP